MSYYTYFRGMNDFFLRGDLSHSLLATIIGHCCKDSVGLLWVPLRRMSYTGNLGTIISEVKDCILRFPEKVPEARMPRMI